MKPIKYEIVRAIWVLKEPLKVLIKNEGLVFCENSCTTDIDFTFAILPTGFIVGITFKSCRTRILTMKFSPASKMTGLKIAVSF